MMKLATPIPKYPSKNVQFNVMDKIAEKTTAKVAAVSVKLSIAVAFKAGEEIVLAQLKFIRPCNIFSPIATIKTITVGQV